MQMSASFLGTMYVFCKTERTTKSVSTMCAQAGVSLSFGGITSVPGHSRRCIAVLRGVTRRCCRCSRLLRPHWGPPSPGLWKMRPSGEDGGEYLRDLPWGKAGQKRRVNCLAITREAHSVAVGVKSIHGVWARALSSAVLSCTMVSYLNMKLTKLRTGEEGRNRFSLGHTASTVPYNV